MLLGCSSEQNQSSFKAPSDSYPYIDPDAPFDLPDALYGNYSEGDDRFILHPSAHLAQIPRAPDTECEKEKLRRLVIAMNMYSYDMMNQSYYLETNTTGAQVLEKAFPKIKKLYGEGGDVINIATLSDHLRGIEIPCEIG